MKALAVLLVSWLALPAVAHGAEPLARTFNAPEERVWTVTQSVLKLLGWDIDKADRAIGFITTDSRRIDGEDYVFYEKGVRHRLRVQVKAAGSNRTTVTIERMLFKRERILFVDKDEPLTPTDQKAEKAVLDAIAKAL